MTFPCLLLEQNKKEKSCKLWTSHLSKVNNITTDPKALDLTLLQDQAQIALENI